jgi:hypothetical protein
MGYAIPHAGRLRHADDSVTVLMAGQRPMALQ